MSDGAEAPIWEFSSLDARPVSSAAFAGKPVALVFVTTYDPISQQQLNYELPLADEFPNVSFVLVALQEPSARELVEIYRDTHEDRRSPSRSRTPRRSPAEGRSATCITSRRSF